MKHWMLIIVFAVGAAVATGLGAPPGLAQDDKSDACRTTVVQRFSTHPTNTHRHPHYRQMVLWSVFGAKQVELRPEGQDEWQTVEDVGFELIQPVSDIRYWLRITNDEGWTFETSTLVDVLERPTVITYSVDPHEVAKGKSALLKWETIHTDYVVMESFTGDPSTVLIPGRTVEEMEKMQRYPATGELTVTPDETTTYSFYAVGKEDGKRTTAVGWGATVTVVR